MPKGIGYGRSRRPVKGRGAKKTLPGRPSRSTRPKRRTLKSHLKAGIGRLKDSLKKLRSRRKK